MLKHASIIITLSTAVLYVLGLSYYQAYLKFLGVDETQFPLQIDRVLFQGFVSSVNMGASGLVWFYLTSLGVVIITLLGLVIFKFIKEHKLITLIKKWFSPDKPNPKDKNNFIEFAIKIFEYAAGILIVFFLTLLVIIASSNVGEEAAKNMINQCNSGQLKKHNIIIPDDSKSVTGCSIVCNSEQCAYLVTDKTLIINKDGTISSETNI